MINVKEYTTIDRAAQGWPSGEWDGEPDKVQWKDESTGMPCLAVRHGHSGHWCGYVGVNPDHPLFEKGYDEPSVEVHGGLTFADSCQKGETEAVGICHVPEPGESDHVWWFGFDCAHCMDIGPLDAKYNNERGWLRKGAYRNLRYVQNQCALLAGQLINYQQQDSTP